MRIRFMLMWFLLFSSYVWPQSTKSSEDQARFHYKVALAAIKQNDYQVASKELEAAVKLSPKNALIHYNLAVVYSKLERIEDAKREVNEAIDIGLAGKDAEDAETLLAELAYKNARDEEFINFFVGQWTCSVNSYYLDGRILRTYTEICAVDSTEQFALRFSCAVGERKRVDKRKFDSSNRTLIFPKPELDSKMAHIAEQLKSLGYVAETGGEYDPVKKFFVVRSGDMRTETVKVIGPNEYHTEFMAEAKALNDGDEPRENQRYKEAEKACVRQK